MSGAGDEFIDDIKEDAAKRMDGALEALKTAFSRIRTGRANAAILDGVQVDYYGTPTPVTRVATVTVEEARTLLISPWEKKMVVDIERAIMKSDLGLNPNSSGDVIRLTLPPLTEENRRDLVRVARAEAEKGRIAIRNVRRDAVGDIRDLVREKEASEDDGHRAEEDIQRITDRHTAAVDEVLAEKEADLLEI